MIESFLVLLKNWCPLGNDILIYFTGFLLHLVGLILCATMVVLWIAWQHRKKIKYRQKQFLDLESKRLW